MIQPINLQQKFELFDDTWHPRIIAEVNDSYVKLARLEGELVWHAHAEEDELFLVLSGRLQIRLRDGDLWLSPGEMAVIPHGVEHYPVAEGEVHVLLLEPKTTKHTGDVMTERTVVTEDWI